MKRWMIPILLLSGCAVEDAQPVDEPAAASQCIVAAEAGGNGGHGGMLALISAGALPENALINASGGVGALAGLFRDGPEAAPGDNGEGGAVELREDATYVFDATGIDPSTQIVASLQDENVLVIDGSDAMPLVRVARFEIGEGATLVVSRFARIEADELVIHRGARLVLRDDGTSSMSVGAEIPIDGASGGQVTIWTRRLVLEGTIDASGSDGAPSQHGGHGGQIVIGAEVLEFGPDAAILVNGGNGGAGEDERPCSE